MIGLSGAHRTGKTTLAKAISKEMGFHYHDASVTKIMRECGINGVADIPLIERIQVQNFILDRFCADVKKAPKRSICDRTPLDMIGYMLGEVTMHNTPADLHGPISNYVDRCLKATEQHFDLVLFVRPLPLFVVEEGKPPENKAYQTLVQYIIEGASQNLNTICGVVEGDKLDDRIEAVCGAIEDRTQYARSITQGHAIH
jgi:predicted ATPase